MLFGILKKLFTQTDRGKIKSAVKEGAFLVDVRTPAEFSTGSVKGAVNIPLNKVENQLSTFKGKKNTVVFCKSGGRSSRAKTILDRNGFTNVINGGTWQNVHQIKEKLESLEQ